RVDRRDPPPRGLRPSGHNHARRCGDGSRRRADGRFAGRAAARPGSVVATARDRRSREPGRLPGARRVCGAPRRGRDRAGRRDPRAGATLRDAVEGARRRGLLGANVMGEGFAFDVEIRRGAGAYIAGEETALFNSIEGKRAEPRNKPPFPVERGLFGKPTGINNVETLMNVLEILRIGGAAYARIGTPDSTGVRLFCLSGCVERPGLYEVEFGTSLRELLALAGGVRGGRPILAVLLGGAAGTFVTPDELD